MRVENTPQEQPVQRPDKPKKKNHKLLILLIILIIIILIPIVLIGASGLYTVPVVSNLFGANKPKDLGIKASQEALDSLLTKFPVKISGSLSDYTLGGNKTLSGQINVDTRTTSEEITSLVQNFNQGAQAVKNTQVKMVEGGLEISSLVVEPVKAPVYVKVMVNKTSSKSVDLDIQKGKVGLFSVPETYLQKAEDWFEERITARLNAVPGFSIEKLEYHDGYSIFKGTFPKTLAPGSGNWIEL